MSNKTNLNDILSALDTAVKTDSHELWVPSLNRKVKFSTLTTGQQKSMVRALVDNPVYQTNFIIAIHQIITENCQEPDIKTDSLSVFDRVALTLQFRALLNPVVKVDEGDIDLSKIDYIEHSKSSLTDAHNMERIVSDGQVTLELGIPTIGREVALEKELRAKMSSTSMESYDDVRSVLADAYIGELAKHIVKIQIGEIVFQTQGAPFLDIYKVVEKIPAVVVAKAVSYMEGTQKALVALRTLPAVARESDINDKIVTPVEITLDAAFFTAK